MQTERASLKNSDIMFEEEDLEEEELFETELLIDLEDLVKQFGMVRIKFPHNLQTDEIITPEGKEIVAADFDDFAI